MWRIALRAFVVQSAAWLLCPTASAQEPASEPRPDATALELDLDRVLELAREAGPAAVSSRAAIREAESLRIGAGVYPTQNPILDVGAGPVLVVGERPAPAVGVGLTQWFELGSRVEARLAAADAAVEGAEARSASASQSAERDAAEAFLRALAAEARLALARDLAGVSAEIVRATERRLEAGDATGLELNVARGAAAKARAEALSEEAGREAALGELRLLLDLPHETALVLRGSLEDPLALERADLLGRARGRPALRVIVAEKKAAEADAALADALAAPDLGVGLRYDHDAGAHTVMGTLSITLPFFERGQGLAATAAARAERAAPELALEERRGATELHTALAVASLQAEAAREFDEGGGVTSFRDNALLAARAYASGETGFGELMFVRRELIDSEQGRLDRVLALRLWELQAMYAAGAMP